MAPGAEKVEPKSEPKVEPKAEKAGGGATVQTLTSNVANFNPATNKWEVAVSNTQVMEFPDEASAKAHLKTAAAEKPEIIDSANPKAPASQEGVVKNLKGLDQSGKDGGATTKDQKVDEQQGPIAHVSAKVATTENKNAPTDACTTKVTDSSESIVSKIKGLTQDAKGYKSTKPEQVMDPQLGPLKEVTAANEKVRVVEATNKKLLAQLSVTESKLLADRAVKVCAITEAQRTEQEVVLAELYQNSPAEFKAYSRLIANLESNAEKTPTLASRGVKKVEASLLGRKSTLVDGSETVRGSGSLENGTLFDD
jgi:hypothetical protein